MGNFDNINRITYNKIAESYIEEAEADHKDKEKIDGFIKTFKGKQVMIQFLMKLLNYLIIQ